MLTFFANILLPKSLKAECFSFVFFGAKILYKKRARKTLVKLTTGFVIDVLACLPYDALNIFDKVRRKKIQFEKMFF